MLVLKSNFKNYFLILLSVIALSSCSSDDDSASDSTSNDATFTATINGVVYNPAFKTAFETTSLNNILVTGSENSGEAIQLFIPSTLTAGTYDLSDSIENGIQAYYQEMDGDADDGAFATSGTLTLTTINTTTKEISGTFSFTGTVPNTGEVITVTEGQFSLDWQEI